MTRYLTQVFPDDLGLIQSLSIQLSKWKLCKMDAIASSVINLIRCLIAHYHWVFNALPRLQILQDYKWSDTGLRVMISSSFSSNVFGSSAKAWWSLPFSFPTKQKKKMLKEKCCSTGWRKTKKNRLPLVTEQFMFDQVCYYICIKATKHSQIQ